MSNDPKEQNLKNYENLTEMTHSVPKNLISYIHFQQKI